MLKVIFKSFLFILIILLSMIEYSFIARGHDLGMLSDFEYLPFLLLILFWLVFFLIEITGRKWRTNYFRLLPSFIGLALIAIFSGAFLYRNSIETSKTIFKASSFDDDFGECTFEFKVNNHFVLTESYKCDHTKYMGKYRIVKDSVFFLSSNRDNFKYFFPKPGVIKRDTLYLDKWHPMSITR